MKKYKKLLAVTLAVAMASVALTGCGNSSSNGSNGDDKAVDENASYTYNDVLPTTGVHTLNPHEWEYNEENTVMTLTQRGLYDIIYSDSEEYEFFCEMASALPEDITSEYAGNDKYGVPADAKEGYAYKIALREDACWDDGTPINADTYIYSMQQIINPEMTNYRTTLYTEGTIALANAYLYYSNGIAYELAFDEESGEVVDFGDAELYTSATKYIPFFGMSLKEANEGDYAGMFTTEDGVDTVAKLLELQGARSWVKVEGEVKDTLDLLIETVNANFEMDAYEGEEYEFMAYAKELEKVDWDSVGLIKNDDYSITIIWDKPVTSQYDIILNLTSPWLVKEDLYEANKQDMGGIMKTTYGTSVDTYSSFGPYKLEAWQEEKEIKLVKNDKWYGYSDDSFEGQYMTTDIVFHLMDDHATELQLFLQGNLEYLALTADDLNTYASSEYVLYTPSDYTWKLSFNTDYDALKARESDGVNKTIITYHDFREAVSLALDRKEFCQVTRPHCSPAYGLLNDLYVYDTNTFATYRDTPQAQKVLMETYAADKIEDVTGFNASLAGELFESAYKAALEAGDIAEGDKVVLEFNTSGADDTTQKTINFISDAINKATEGTSFEGKISIEIKDVDDFYAAMKDGTADMIFSAWAGNDTDPYSMLQCYCDITLYDDGEHGFDSSKEFTATIGGTEYTYSYYDWYYELCEGQWALSDAETRLEVLATVEGALLKEYNTIPIWSTRTAALLSQKVDYITYDYNFKISEAYGGIRFMTYNYTDDEWADYCAENNNQLTY